MASSSTTQTWLVERLPTATNRAYNKRRSKLSDAVRSGNWIQIFSILEDAHKRYHESWIDCPTSTDGWTLLHHAAYKGIPVSTVNRLLRIGASCSIRTVHTHGTSLSRNDRTPRGIAIEMKRRDLYEVLKPVFAFAVSEATLQRVESHFHKVIRDQMSWPESGRVRLPKLGVLREGTGWGWFPVSPGVNRKGDDVIHNAKEEIKMTSMWMQGYLYRLRVTSLQVWKFDAKGRLEGQTRIGEDDVVTVPKGDRDYVATPWKIARSSGGGTGIPYSDTIPIPTGYPRTTETSTVYKSTISKSYASYSASNSESLNYDENDNGLYDNTEVADPDEYPNDVLYYDGDVENYLYDSDYSPFDTSFTDDDYYDGDYNDVDISDADDGYYDGDYNDVDVAYADDEYYNGFYDDVDVADPDPNDVPYEADPDDDSGDDLDGVDHEADLIEADTDEADPDDYPDVADPDEDDDLDL